jgi:xylulokinase
MLSIGGGSNSPLFNSIKANVLGVRVETFETGETALIGSAVIAGIGTGALSDYEQPIQGIMKKRHSFTPDHDRYAQYKPYAAAYLAAMEHITQFYKTNPFAT